MIYTISAQIWLTHLELHVALIYSHLSLPNLLIFLQLSVGAIAMHVCTKYMFNIISLHRLYQSYINQYIFAAPMVISQTTTVCEQICSKTSFLHCFRLLSFRCLPQLLPCLRNP